MKQKEEVRIDFLTTESYSALDIGRRWRCVKKFKEVLKTNHLVASDAGHEKSLPKWIWQVSWRNCIATDGTILNSPIFFEQDANLRVCIIAYISRNWTVTWQALLLGQLLYI